MSLVNLEVGDIYTENGIEYIIIGQRVDENGAVITSMQPS